MPITDGSVVQVTYNSNYFNNAVQLVTNWKVSNNTSTGTLLGDLGLIAAHFKDMTAGTFGAAYKKCLANNVIIDTVRAQQVRPTRSLYYEEEVVVNGGATDAADTGNLAATITRRSNAAGRKGVSNSHVGPIPRTAVVDGYVWAGYKTDLATLAALLSGFQTVGQGVMVLNPVILHAPADPIVSTPVEVYSLGNTIRTMRRRTLGLGI